MGVSLLPAMLFLLYSTYPNVKFDILVLYCLYIEADSGNGCDALIELELV
jgi:hypothetical protein